MTARQMWAALTAAGCQLAVDGEELILDRPPPDALAGPLAVLHTGVGALLTGRRWHAYDPTSGKACGPFPARGHGLLAFGALDPTRPIPSTVGLLSVAGDTCWDRLPPFARSDLPDLFAPDIERPPKTR